MEIKNSLAALVLVPLFGIIALVAILLMSFINAIICYFIWNHIAPIYFTGILPVQFIHLPFFHCWMFLYILALVFGSKATAVETKK